MKIRFSTILDHQFFPINDHTLFLVLQNDAVRAEDVIFDVSDSGLKLSKDAKISNWDLIGGQIESGYFKTDNTMKMEAHPRVVYSLFIKKLGLRQVHVIILPILLILFISTAVLLPLEKSMQAGLTVNIGVGALTGILAYRFIIVSLSPNVGYFTLAEHIYNACLIMIFINFLITLIISMFPKNHIIHILAYPWFIGNIILISGTIIYLLYLWNPKEAKHSCTQYPLKQLDETSRIPSFLFSQK